MITVWGLKNCDTCKKARAWLDGRSVSHAFKDVRADAVAAGDVKAWLDAVGADVLLNRRGTTWRGLDDAARAKAETPAGLVELLVANPALIKRPVFVGGDGTVVVGFGKAEQARVEALG
ncbi:arsenate reductase [Thalassobaculum fulvum]|uniref:Arsenate reductase n=1 Tax=Thalassobaculum fulvum TaxID=1633335 RepID=A0A918XUY9_9PROT|nr:Spx/MgsR family RNA polymerase-binding regulatory protein [Thalassobaculum fulvum]GHD58356.1 arsenate reductase [Thalassobaculum fulvum]